MNNSGEFNLSRRQFLRGSSAVATLSLFSINPVVHAMDKAGYSVNVEVNSGTWEPTVCNGCTSFCAKQVYVQNGRAIHIRGNEHSKIHGTAGCSRQYLALQELYDPDRIKKPMIRTNPAKGRGIDPKFKQVSWDEAMDLFAEKLMALREKNETHKYVTLRGRYSMFSDVLMKNMTSIIGSSNAISHSALCAEADKFGSYFTEGNWGYRQWDIKNTKYILSFGVDPLSANRQVSYHNQHWGNMLDNAKVTIVDPRFSASAAKAHSWLPIMPGQDGALALALAHEILVKGTWYKEFVGDFNDGQNRFKSGEMVDESLFTDKHSYGLVKWWNLELKDRTPEWAESLCRISAKQIRQIAKDLGDNAPNIQIWRSRGSQMQTRGAYTAMAMNALNGLLGAVDNVGGTMDWGSTVSVINPSPSAYQDEIAKNGLKKEKIDRRGRLEFPNLKKGKSGGGVSTGAVATSILEADPYLPEVVLSYFNNFNFSAPGNEMWDQALAKVPFMVHVTTHVSELTWFSDLVLPAPHFMFERWGLQKSSSNRHASLALSKPIIQNIAEVEDEAGLPWLMAKALSRKGFHEPMKYLQDNFKDPETGKAPNTHREFGVYMAKTMTQNIWDPAKYQSGTKFSGWEDFLKVGVWNSDEMPYKKRWSKMKTKTKKFEFYSETLHYSLKKHGDKHNVSIDEVMAACDYQARGEQAWIPHYEEPIRYGDEQDFPFLFVDHKLRLSREGRSANCSWYSANYDIDPGEIPDYDTVKINPIDAKRLGIKDHDEVRLTTVQGSIVCRVKLFEGIRPNTVSKAFGRGHWAYGKRASKKFGLIPNGGSNNELMPQAFERLSGSSAFYGQIGVKVEKV